MAKNKIIMITVGSGIESSIEFFRADGLNRWYLCDRDKRPQLFTRLSKTIVQHCEVTEIEFDFSTIVVSFVPKGE